MKRCSSSLLRIIALFLMVFALDGMLSMHSLGVECFECAETDVEFLEEIEEAEEHRSHRKPTFNGKLPTWSLFTSLLYCSRVTEPLVQTTYFAVLEPTRAESVVQLDSADCYLFFGDSSPPHHS